MLLIGPSSAVAEPKAGLDDEKPMNTMFSVLVSVGAPL
ncbi:hypothetical protein SZ55_3113 [Pseudomonas sp. FeS53a]|nr:hypothetical protein SZ55_3113 [Pseudomonas sp. FeS53a]